MKLVTMLGAADQPADRVAVIHGDSRLTRAEALTAVSRTAAALERHGVAPGDRVVAVLDHDPAGIFFLAAASALDLRVMMPYNLQAAALPEWVGIVSETRPDHVVVLKEDPGALAALEETGAHVVSRADVDTSANVSAMVGQGPGGSATADSWRAGGPPTDRFLVLFSSGTTGAPKAICLSEEAICRRITAVTTKLQFSPAARVFMSGLVNNTTGFIFSFGAWHHGATVVFPDGRDFARWPRQIAGAGVTHVMLRPAALRRFLEGLGEQPVDLGCLQVVAYGAAAMPRDLLEAARQAMPCQWVQGYGLSETFGPFCWLDEEGHRQRRYRRNAYCVGAPDDTVEVRLDQLEGHPPGTGEVVLRSPALMDGYYHPATDRVDPVGEWFRTGDVAEWSPDGDLLLKARLHGSVMSENGHRIYPEEVEAVLAEVPGIDDVALVGVPGGELLVERPVACFAGPLTDRGAAEARDAIVEVLRAALAREKWPDYLYPSSSPLPRGSGEKILRGQLVARIDPAALVPLELEPVGSPG